MVSVKDQKLMRQSGSLPPQSSLLWGTVWSRSARDTLCGWQEQAVGARELGLNLGDWLIHSPTSIGATLYMPGTCSKCCRWWARL